MYVNILWVTFIQQVDFTNKKKGRSAGGGGGGGEVGPTHFSPNLKKIVENYHNGVGGVIIINI